MIEGDQTQDPVKHVISRSSHKIKSQTGQASQGDDSSFWNKKEQKDAQKVVEEANIYK